MDQYSEDTTYSLNIWRRPEVTVDVRRNASVPPIEPAVNQIPQQSRTSQFINPLCSVDLLGDFRLLLRSSQTCGQQCGARRLKPHLRLPSVLIDIYNTKFRPCIIRNGMVARVVWPRECHSLRRISIGSTAPRPSPSITLMDAPKPIFCCSTGGGNASMSSGDGTVLNLRDRRSR